MIGVLTNDSLFLDSLASQKLASAMLAPNAACYSSWLRSQINSDVLMKNVIDKIQATSYSQWELMELPNILTRISEYELRQLHQSLGISYLLIPYEFSIHDSGKYTTGYCQFRLYDLITGDFIMVFRTDNPDPSTGPEAVRRVAEKMIEEVAAETARVLN